MEANRQIKNVTIKLYSNMLVVKTKLLFNYSTLYLFNIFAILNYDILKKMPKFIYLYLRLFRITGWDKLFNGMRLGQVFVPKKIKGRE